MQTTAIGTVANSLPENEVILLTLLISKGYIPYTDLQIKSDIRKNEVELLDNQFLLVEAVPVTFVFKGGVQILPLLRQKTERMPPSSFFFCYFANCGLLLCLKSCMFASHHILA